MRNLGAYHGWAAREINERIERGDFPGPRIQYAGFYLTVPAGGGVAMDIDETTISSDLGKFTVADLCRMAMDIYKGRIAGRGCMTMYVHKGCF